MIGNCFFDFPYLERYRIFLFLFSVFLLLKGIWEFQNEYFERVTGMSKKNWKWSFAFVRFREDKVIVWIPMTRPVQFFVTAWRIRDWSWSPILRVPTTVHYSYSFTILSGYNNSMLTQTKQVSNIGLLLMWYHENSFVVRIIFISYHILHHFLP